MEGGGLVDYKKIPSTRDMLPKDTHRTNPNYISAGCYVAGARCKVESAMSCCPSDLVSQD